MFESDRERWMAVADALAPVIETKLFPAVSVVRPVEDASAYQGWRLDRSGAARGVLVGREPVILDFGVHLVGRVRFKLGGDDGRVLVRFGEAPAEVCEPPSRFPGTLGAEWLNTFELDPDGDGWATVPGRRALRYARVWVEQKGVESETAAIESAQVVAQTSASWSDPPLDPAAEPWQRDLDRVALHTLRNCMHEVFEDGPKRDRRLWLGDLYVQAKTSYLTFRADALVKRCLYLFAGASCDRGLISPCVFAKPHWHGSHKLIPSYAWLFAPCLLDYVRATGDRAAAADLFGIAVHQHTLFDEHANAQGLFDPQGDVLWRFIDWNESLDPQAAEQAVAIYSLNALIELAPFAGRGDAVRPLRRRRDALAAAAREHFYDAGRGLFVSGKNGQVASATQAWMVLADVAPPGEGARVLRRLLEADDAVPPVTPYMQHTVVAAMFAAGMEDLAWQRVRAFWGAMLDRGATTFWELYDPGDPTLSPYGSHLHNSYCHAWSCTPSWFIRRALPTPRPADEANRAAAIGGKAAATC